MSHDHLQANFHLGKLISMYFKSHLKTVFFNESDIIYCKAEGCYTSIHLKDNQTLTISKVLKSLESLLSNERFCRCHRSYLVNKEQVLYYNNKNGCLVLSNKVEIPVSKRKLEFVFTTLNNSYTY